LLPLLKLDHHLDRFAVVHRALAVGHVVEFDNAVEHAAGFDPPVEDIRQQLFNTRERAPGPGDLMLL
jgi:hypothetical protein